MKYPIYSFLVLPYMRQELPGWGKLAKLFRVAVPVGSNLWENAPIRNVRAKRHHYLMECHLSDWSERMTYFLGRYYELETALIIERLLCHGDSFVDIGGNIGMVTLMAADAVGTEGIVQTFEPNPECLKRLESMLRLNDINNVILYDFGLSDMDESLPLSNPSKHSGVGTFAPISNHEVVTRMILDVKVGDNVLAKNQVKIKLIKMDVEGFETRVINGLYKTIDRDHPCILQEVSESHLRRAGSSTDELFCHMHDFGYKGYGVTLRRKMFNYNLELVPVKSSGDVAEFNDVFWSHPRGPIIDDLIKT